MNNTKKEQRKQNYEELYADANLFIYSILDEGGVGERARKIIGSIESEEIKAFTSTLTIDEILWKVQKELGKGEAVEAAKSFFSLVNLTFISVGQKVISDVLDNYLEGGLDPRDAIHLACMRNKNLKVIMSSDADFDKVKGVRRIDFSKGGVGKAVGRNDV